MKSILVEAWDNFKVCTGKFVRESFVKTELDHLSSPELTTHTQAYFASVQVFSGAKSE